MARPRLYLRPYREGDLQRVPARADFRAEMAAVEWGDGPSPARTWTLMAEWVGDCDKIRGVGGVYDAGDGVWMAWAILADLTPREFCVAGPLAEDVLAAVELVSAPDRIVATARTSLTGAVAVLEKLGFAAKGQVTDERVGRDVVYELMVRAA